MRYGRLANPDATLGTDPRIDPRAAAALAPVGLDGRLPLPPVKPDSPLHERLEYIATAESLIVAGLTYLAQSAPTVENVTTETTTIAGTDGNDITLYISRPAAASTVPSIVHIHGGGMAFGGATDLGYIRWRENLAATGIVVVGVEFRNSAGRLGPYPFPAGLDDCAAATRWTAAHLGDLGASHIVVSGESGGGNLSPWPHPQGQTGRMARRDRRGLRAMSLHLEPLPRAARRLAVAHGERRLHLQPLGVGGERLGLRPPTGGTPTTPRAGRATRPTPISRACHHT